MGFGNTTLLHALQILAAYVAGQRGLQSRQIADQQVLDWNDPDALAQFLHLALAHEIPSVSAAALVRSTCNATFREAVSLVRAIKERHSEPTVVREYRFFYDKGRGDLNNPNA